MKQHISVNLYADQLEELKKLVPSETRNKSKFLRQYLKKEYKLPENVTSLQLEPKRKLVDDHIILDKESIYILDRYVEEIKHHLSEANRSTIMRDVVNKFIDQGDPDLTEKYSRSFQVEKGMKEKLDEFINKRDRSSALDFFIKNEYQGPKKTRGELKKPLEDKEQIMVYMHGSTYEKLDAIAHECNVKRVHVFRDVLDQFLLDQEEEKNEFHDIIKQALYQLEQQVPTQEIHEFLEKYEKGKMNNE